MLWVYELKGSGRPRSVPKEGLEGVWPEPPFYYLFYGTESLESILEWLESRPDWRLTSRYCLPYERWQDISIPQIRLGSFVIRLSTGPADMPDIPDGIAIRLDPGIVFGSGLHPTTQGCLLAISEIFGRNEIHTAVDFGAGTGILAAACALAGAKSVLAIDRNPLALKISSKNARANGVSGRIAFVEADRLQVVGIRPDLLIMNLEWPILEKILAEGEWRTAGRIVLAGFLESRLEPVKRFVRPGFLVENLIVREGWPTVTLSRGRQSRRRDLDAPRGGRIVSHSRT
jgi:ribosomal protein L11 methyltransferase